MLQWAGLVEYYALGWRGPVLVLEDPNRRCSSIIETQLTVYHHSINNWNLRLVWESVGYGVSWSQCGSCQLCIWSYEVLNVDIKNFVKELLRKELWLLLKPYLESLCLHSWVLSVFISVKSCWVLLYSGFVDPCCTWASWAGLLWTVLDDRCSNRWW